jgi:hypothetical protein
MYQKTTIGAGSRTEFIEASDFFRILAAQQVITVEFYLNGAKVAEAFDVGTGYAEKIPSGFDRIAITSATAQTIQFVTRLGGDVRYDQPPTGNVNIANTAGAFNQAQATVTTTSGQLKAANAARRYLLIQNNDSSGDIYVTLDGTTATTAKGIKLAAGSSMELSSYAPTGAINAIGSIASNANVVIVEA